MKLLVLAPAYWATPEDVKDKCWLYLASCRKALVPPENQMFYGVGSRRYEGTARMRVYDQASFLSKVSGGYTHVLFSDAWDVLFCAPLTEIVEKYKRMGSPPFLMGAAPREFGFLDVHEPESYAGLLQDLPYCIPATNFHIGEIRYIADRLSQIPEGFHNESYAFLKVWQEKKWSDVLLDTQCEIFIENGGHRPKGAHAIVKDGRLYNPVTNTYPCMVHFGGGYVDPAKGKDAAIEPWARELGII